MALQIQKALARNSVADEARRESLSILRLPTVRRRVGLSRSTIYDRLDPESKRYDPSFPKPISLGSRAVGWLSTEVDAWLLSRIEKSRPVPVSPDMSA
jgi:prophage regulatory protein